MTTQTPPILQFPQLPYFAYSTHKEPTFSSLVSTHVSGKETIVVTQAYPIWQFTLTFEFLREQTQNKIPDPNRVPYVELEKLAGLYLACRGRYGRFVFDDPTDDSRTDSLIGTGNGSQTIFTVPRSFGTFSEPVGSLSSVSAVYLNGVEQSTESYGWGPHWGSPNPWYIADNTYLGNKIVFVDPPTSGVTITADFMYQFLCRFSEDQQDFEEFMFNLWRVSTLKFRSVKV